MPTSDEEKTPKPRKVKAKVRHAIDTTAKMIAETNGKGDKYGDCHDTDVVESMMSSKQHEERPGGRPAPKDSSQLQAVGGRALKRDGAIADINALYKKPAAINSNRSQPLKHSPDMDISDINDVMDIDNRY